MKLIALMTAVLVVGGCAVQPVAYDPYAVPVYVPPAVVYTPPVVIYRGYAPGYYHRCRYCR